MLYFIFPLISHTVTKALYFKHQECREWNKKNYKWLSWCAN